MTRMYDQKNRMMREKNHNRFLQWSTFEAFMNHIFADIIAEWRLKIYMDNLGFHTQGDLDLHHQQTCWVLFCLYKHGLSLKISKCSFNTPTMEYLGMIIGQGLVCMDPANFLLFMTSNFLPLSKEYTHFLGALTSIGNLSPTIPTSLLSLLFSLTKTIPGLGLTLNNKPLTLFDPYSHPHLSSAYLMSLTPFLSWQMLLCLLLVLYSYRQMPLETSILVLISPRPSLSLNRMTFMTRNFSQ